LHPDLEARQEQRHIKLVGDTMYDLDKPLVKVSKLNNEAILPVRANKTDAGWDLYSMESKLIRGGDRATFRTGICFEIPKDYVGLIWPRSGLAVNKGIDVLAGVIDSGYRGEIIVCLLNTNKALPLFQDNSIDIGIDKGDKIAQILFQQVPEINMVEVDSLEDSDRGEKGFGSSGS